MPTAYAGNAGNYPSAVNILSGSDVPNTTTFNTAYEGTLDRTAFLHGAVPLVGQSWRPSFGVATVHASSIRFMHPGWDPLEGTWLTAVEGPTLGDTGGFVYWSFGADDGAGWTQVGTAEIDTDPTGMRDLAVCADYATPGKLWVAMILDTAGQINVYNVPSYTGAWTNVVTLDSTAPDNVEIATIGTTVVVAYGGTDGTSPTHVKYKPSGGSWTTAPIAITATTGDKIAWLLKTNGSLIVACPIFNAPLWTSPDGITWTEQSTGAIEPSLSKAAGLAWSSVTQLWYIVIQLTSSTTKIYSSPDAITWTAVAASGPALSVADFACVSNGLVITTSDATVLGVVKTSRTYFSPDFGVTWYPAFATFQGNNSPGLSFLRARMAASESGLLACNALHARFSNVAGLPPHL